MKFMDDSWISGFFSQLANAFELRLPLLLPDGGRSIGSPEDGEICLIGGTILAKPTAHFFPQAEKILTMSGFDVEPSVSGYKPLLIAGFSANDLRCLAFADRFFSDGYRDDLYFRQRENAIIVAVTGYCGENGSMMPIANGGCDLELIKLGDGWLVASYSERGEEISGTISCDAPSDLVSQLDGINCKMCDNRDEVVVKEASRLLMDGKIPDSFWEEIAACCIQCLGCNLVCPTCSCFGVQDWRYADRTERSRIWDSCQLEGFSREAGGHNPMGTEALRTRRRIHHKLAADLTRWGEIGCFACGRCDATCPTGIGIIGVANRMVEKFG